MKIDQHKKLFMNSPKPHFCDVLYFHLVRLFYICWLLSHLRPKRLPWLPLREGMSMPMYTHVHPWGVQVSLQPGLIWQSKARFLLAFEILESLWLSNLMASSLLDMLLYLSTTCVNSSWWYIHFAHEMIFLKQWPWESFKSNHLEMSENTFNVAFLH